MAMVNGLNMDSLMKVVETVKQNWEIGKTVWKASTSWKGSALPVELSAHLKFNLI